MTSQTEGIEHFIMSPAEKLHKVLVRISQQPDFKTQQLAKDALRHFADAALEQLNEAIREEQAEAALPPIDPSVVFVSAPLWPMAQS